MWIQVSFQNVLDLAELETTFFTAAPVVLYLAFVTKTVLITYQCFGCC